MSTEAPSDAADTRPGLELPRVKVCGLTRAQDVRAALEAGADALGFVIHAPSCRHVQPARIAELLEERECRALTVLVMVDKSPQFARAALETSGARAVQLCGDERASQWRDFPAPILRRVPVSAEGELVLREWREVALGFVLDHPRSPGGSGLAVDRELAAHLALEAPCLLAGGLGPGLVAQAVAAVAPLGVDASSLLESAPGEKSKTLVQDFVCQARAALTLLEP